MFGRDFSGAETSEVGVPQSLVAKRRAALDTASTFSGMAFPERRTALLVLAGLVRSECDVSTLHEAYQDLADAKVIPLLAALRHHCPSTFRHCVRTMKFVMIIVRRLGISRQEHASICVGALLHDIGKLSLPIDLLRLSRELKPAEVEKIRQHSEAGYESICDKRVFGWNAVLDIVRHHHERLDGSGYPLGLAANQISLRTRCVSVGDVFGALTEHRPYRAALSAEKAFGILSDLVAAGKLDGGVVSALGAGLGLAAGPS
ncbi:HD domain-containing phosphohydrolase [Pleomorphomonas sp. JP5]|uniref:HD-GYP domain-containing protein n=1 Tax=Pleomorphomonas sp. JP5 TaxID=2942998 RepID=UPI002042FD9A|nr:HD domain-containing phosphohydrolase [Pleomorphomonas sp. JP5]MCM5557487.1 HD domain-containing protein [Pleomorphomonas sp. JP5]